MSVRVRLYGNGRGQRGHERGMDAGMDGGISVGMDGGISVGIDAGMDASTAAGMDAGTDMDIDIDIFERKKMARSVCGTGVLRQRHSSLFEQFFGTGLRKIYKCKSTCFEQPAKQF
jgi:hypothetical protein